MNFFRRWTNECVITGGSLKIYTKSGISSYAYLSYANSTLWMEQGKQEK